MHFSMVLKGIQTLAVATGLLLAGHGKAVSGEACQTIRVNGSSTWYPVSKRYSANGPIEGVLPALASGFFKEIDLPVDLGPSLPWKRLFALLEAGEIDLMTGAYFNEERAEKFVLSQPVYQENVAVFVRADLPSLPRDRDELIGLHGIWPLGASFGLPFDRFAERNLDMLRMSYEDLEDLLPVLFDGKADYFVMAREHGLEVVRQAGMDGKIVPLDWPVAVNPIHFLFAKNSPCAHYVGPLNDYIARMRSSGRIDALIAQYSRNY